MNRRQTLKGIAAGLIGASFLFANAWAEKSDNMPAAVVTATTQGAVLILEIELPPINGVTIGVLKNINKALDIAKNDTTIGAIVITGSNHVFSGGSGENSPGETGPEGQSHAEYAHATFNRMEAHPKPIIAAIRGVAANGGNELALACDIRIAADNARFAQLEVHAGLFPGFGGTQRLPRLIEHGRATEVILTGRMVGAEEAQAMGLVSKVTPLDDTLAVAVALGQQLADTLDPNAVRVYKTRVSLGANEPYLEALKNDQTAFDELAASPEAKVAMERFIRRQGK
jgi:enoyl-CoA hydratase/carnithine racemase